MTAAVTETEGNWRALAACATANPALFAAPDSDEGESPDRRAGREKRALKVCARCPVQAACLDFAVETGAQNGVWGGLTEGRMQRHARSVRRSRLENAS